MIMSLIISRAILHYFLYLSNKIISHKVHLLNNYTFPTQELIFESFALPSLENTIGTISPFLFAINNRESCSKRHLKNIILLNIHRIHKWRTRGKKLVPNHENEALEDNKHKFLTDSTVLVNLQSGDFFFLQRFGGLFLL